MSRQQNDNLVTPVQVPQEQDENLMDDPRFEAPAIEQIHTREKFYHVILQMESAFMAGAIGMWSWDILADRVYADSNLREIFQRL